MKREARNRLFIFSIVVLEILLLISLSFVISFLLNENLVSAQNAINPVQTVPVVELSTKEIFLPGKEGYSTVFKAWQTPDSSQLFVQYKEGEELTQFVKDPLTKNWVPPSASVGTDVQANFGIWKPTIDIPGIGLSGNFFVAHLLEGVVWGGVVALTIKFIGPMLGLSEEQSNAAAISAFAGIASAKVLYGVFGQGGVWQNVKILNTVFGTVPGAFVVGGLIAFAIFAATYKKEKI